MAFIEYPECGKIINTHGCHGGVKVEPWCDSPAVFAALPVVYLKENGTYHPRRLQRAAVLGGRFVSAELEGVSTMEEADALRGRVLYAKREDLHLPAGVLLVAELLGLPVYHAESGERLGVLTDVIHPGASDIYVIDTPRGQAMVPVVPEFVLEVSMEKGIVIRPIEGLLP
ncbi:MAG: 16S rRNA processing protein RimM [Ruminococcaceae bacterium]|nr:16S rRNA processing protein RimM [Oscillospiraceae bacterium]